MATGTLVLVLVLSVFIGVSLGLLGGGGSILTVPILVYVADLPAHEAIAASLFVVGTTSLAGMLSHARAGRVRWRTGLVFGLAGMAGAFAGGLIGGKAPGDLLLVAFGLMMVAMSVAMIRGRRNPPDPHPTDHLPVARILVDGASVGLVSGLVGAGGGFLVVPALVLLGGLPMSIAVGTSLLVIAMQTLAGFAGYLTSVHLDWTLVLSVTAAAVVGSLIGGRLAGRIPEEALRKAFGWFVLAMGIFVLSQQGPAGTVTVLAVVAGGLGIAAAFCRLFVPSCPLRRRSAAPDRADEQVEHRT